MNWIDHYKNLKERRVLPKVNSNELKRHKRYKMKNFNNTRFLIESARSKKTFKSLEKSKNRVHITGSILLHYPEWNSNGNEEDYYKRFKNTIGLVTSTYHPEKDALRAFEPIGPGTRSYGENLSKGYTRTDTAAGQAWENHQTKMHSFISQPAFKAIKKKFGKHAWQKRSGWLNPGTRSLSDPVNEGTNYGIARYGKNGYHMFMSKFATPFSLLAKPESFFNSDLFQPTISGKSIKKSEIPQDKDILSMRIRDKRTGEIKRLHDLPEMHDFAYSVDVATRHTNRFENTYEENNRKSLSGLPQEFLSNTLKCSDCRLKMDPSKAFDFANNSRDNLLSTLSNYEPHPHQLEEWNTLHHVLKNGELDYDDKPSKLSLGNLREQGAGKTFEGHNLLGGGPQQLIIRGWSAPRPQESEAKTSAKIPVGYKGKNGFLCVHCIHHNDIRHDGYKPVTRGNPKNCIRCGEED